MEINSPLHYLNYDVSRYLYETYFPSKQAKENKKKLNKEFCKQVNSYLFRYQINNIYEQEVTFCIRGSLYKKVPFLSYLYSPKAKEINIHKKLTDSEKRAVNYKAEAILLKEKTQIFS